VEQVFESSLTAILLQVTNRLVALEHVA
jgi:hypothetical protein